MLKVRMVSGWATRGRVLEPGDELELDPAVARAWVADGLAELVDASAAPAETAMRAPAETALSRPTRPRGR